MHTKFAPIVAAVMSIIIVMLNDKFYIRLCDATMAT